MARWIQAVTAVILALLVLYICVSPAFDLDPTAMSAAQKARLAALALISAAALLFLLLDPRCYRMFEAGWNGHLAPPSADLNDLHCSRLC